jgi:hypothetical protein
VGNCALKTNNLSFSGAILENTDYTVFAIQPYPDRVQVFRNGWSTRVLNVPTPPVASSVAPRPARIVGSSSGTRTPTSWALHWPTQYRAPYSPSNGFKVYAFRFSRTEGMSAYMNGVLLGSDATAITPVIDFSNAEIGCVGGEATNIGRRVRITELKGVGHAVSHDEILEETQRLRLKYGI